MLTKTGVEIRGRFCYVTVTLRKTMKKKQRRLATLRNKIVKVLETFGIQRSDESLQEDWFLERYLKTVNTGEAYYYLESRMFDIIRLWKNILLERTTLAKSRDVFGQQLHYGIEFSYKRNGRKKYEIINLINWDKPEANTFRYHLKVPAFRKFSLMKDVPTDDFIWDLIISVNHLPMVAVVIEPNAFKESKPCVTAYESMKLELERDPFMATYVQICIISDGSTTLVGTTTDSLSNFRQWPSLMGELTDEPDVLTPFVSLLRPDRLLDVIRNFVRIIIYRENTDNILYLADWKKYFAVTNVANAIKKHLATINTAMVGHVLLEQDAEWQDFGMGDDISVTIQLLMDYLLTENIIPDDTLLCKVTEEMPTNRPKVKRDNNNAPIIMLCDSDINTCDCMRYHEHFPDISLIQFNRVPNIGYPQQFIGETIYRQNIGRVR